MIVMIRQQTKRWGGLIAAGLLMSLWLVGCQPSPQSELQRHQSTWQAQEIDSYEITVFYSSLWILQTYHLTVQNGEVIAHSTECQPSLLSFDGTCEPEPYEPDAFTVPGLFALVDGYVTRETSSKYNDGEQMTVIYDEQYGFPQSIMYRNPEITDSDFAYEVQAFVVGNGR